MKRLFSILFKINVTLKTHKLLLSSAILLLVNSTAFACTGECLTNAFPLTTRPTVGLSNDALAFEFQCLRKMHSLVDKWQGRKHKIMNKLYKIIQFNDPLTSLLNFFA